MNVILVKHKNNLKQDSKGETNFQTHFSHVISAIPKLLQGCSPNLLATVISWN